MALHPRFAIEVSKPLDSNNYVITEPNSERTIPFLIEVAQFVRELASDKTATVKLIDGDTMDFGACGTTLRVALSKLFSHFVKGKRDLFAAVVEKVEIDADGHMQIQVNPAKVNRTGKPDHLTDNNVVAYQLREIGLYFDTFAERNLLPQFMTMLGASDQESGKAIPINRQAEIARLPLRFVSQEGKRISLVERHNPNQRGTNLDLDFG